MVLGPMYIMLMAIQGTTNLIDGIGDKTIGENYEMVLTNRMVIGLIRPES